MKRPRVSNSQTIEHYNTLNSTSSQPKSLYYDLPVDLPTRVSAIPQLVLPNLPLSESSTLLHRSDRHISFRKSTTTNSVAESYTASASSGSASTRHMPSYTSTSANPLWNQYWFERYIASHAILTVWQIHGMSDERRKSYQILTILIRINPHIGAQFPASRPKKQDLSVLKPSFKPWLTWY